MNWTKLSLANPAAVAAAAAIVVVFGLIALADMPIQMLPNVERPTITIFNNWRAAAPKCWSSIATAGSSLYVPDAPPAMI